MTEFDFFKRERMNGLNEQLYVYKYIKLKYLKPLIKNKKLRIDKVSQWDDPYENFFLKSNFYTYASFYEQIVQVHTDEVSNRIYGQSWTILEESDAMWRIYSDKNNIENTAIKIKIKVGNLFNIVYTSDKCMATTSIDCVKYKTDEEISNWMQSLKNIGSNFPKYAEQCLFIKRKPFEHESEVRIIISKDTQKPAESFIEYDIPDIDYIEEFVLDPRLNEERVQEINQQLCDVGVNMDKIKKSKLYEFAPINLNI